MKPTTMQFEHVFIPYGVYWSTPFCRWQGSFASLHPLKFAAQIGERALAERNLSPDRLDSLFLGTSVPSIGSFYGAPWVAAMIGMPGLTGPTIAQACATSARLLATAAAQLECQQSGAILGLTADRTSNGPHLVYPNPEAPGGTPSTDDWVWNNFNCDPQTQESMLQTAESVAREEGISRAEQDAVSLTRFEQYRQALSSDAEFLRRFLVQPIEVPLPGKRTARVENDEGVYPTSSEKLARLRPVQPDGTVTFGGQTYPADGNAGMVIADKSRARELSRRSEVEVQLLGYAESRVEAARMPKAPVPAAQKVLASADLRVTDLAAVKTHNPFAVNDVYFSRKMGLPVEGFNNFGSSLVWGHPQAPTGMRLIMELIEEIEMKGGGYGLFSGCAASDSAAAVLLKVD